MEEKKFVLKLAKEMNGEDLNMNYIQEYDFTTPMRFADKNGLGETKLVILFVHYSFRFISVHCTYLILLGC